MINITHQSTIFNAFHDGSFLLLRRNKRDIEFQVEIQYLASTIDPTYTHFRGTLINCRQCAFDLWDEEKARYEDLDVISGLLIDMEISNARYEGDHVYVHCLGDQNYSGGTLSFACDAIRIFDEGGKELSIDELCALAEQYWNLYR